MSLKDKDENSEMWTPIEGSTKLRWIRDSHFYTNDNVRITVQTAKEDPSAIMYVLKTPDGKRYLLQRTKDEIILVASDTKNDTIRFIAVENKK
ncbi:hypothetical protein M3Y96_01172100 [Aphelenchoides besseyi]|nr:hypothetical protein M3Y96_01172100 [Aphelenchoides besseyi]